MLRLDLTNEPRWLDLGSGVRLLLRPADLDLLAEAEEDPEMAALRAELPVGDEAPSSEIKRALGLAMARAIVRVAILDWEGVGDADGNPIPVSREGIDALMRHPVINTRLQTDYLHPALTLVSEGNGFAPGRNGTSAAAPTTAATARRAATPAPSGKTARKR